MCQYEYLAVKLTFDFAFFTTVFFDFVRFFLKKIRYLETVFKINLQTKEAVEG